jgi:hypothetical protein
MYIFEYFKQLEVQLKKDYKAGVQVFPPKHLIFNAFNKTPIDKVNTLLKESIKYSVMCSVLRYKEREQRKTKII